MQLPGKWVVLAVVVGSAAILGAFFLTGEDLRQEYHVASRGDTERTDVDLWGDRVAWLEDAEPGGAVLWYDLATKKRTTLEARNASLAGGIALDGDLVAWMQSTPAGPRIRVHDLARGFGAFVGAPGDDLALVPHALEGRTLLARGTTVEGGGPGLWRLEVSLTAPDVAGTSTAAVPGPADAPAMLSQGRVWWVEGRTLRAADALTRRAIVDIPAAAPVASFDVDGDLVAWTQVHGDHRRVSWMDLGNGTRGNASAFPADQHGPAVNGTSVVFVQYDGLVRHVDLRSGAEKVLPARTQENIGLRLGRTWAAWLSGTIEGHNVFVTPVPPPG